MSSPFPVFHVQRYRQLRLHRPVQPLARHERRAATLAQLVTGVALALSTIVAATVVSVGIARADVAGNVVDNESGLFGIALLLGLIFIGIGGFSLLPARAETTGINPQALSEPSPIPHSLCGAEGKHYPRHSIAHGPIAACWHPAPAAAQIFPSSAGELKVDTVAGGLVHPWSLAFLPDGRMLVTERPGRMRIVTRGGQLSPPLGGVPEVFAQRTSRPHGRDAGARFRKIPHGLFLLCRTGRGRRRSIAVAHAQSKEDSRSDPARGGDR